MLYSMALATLTMALHYFLLGFDYGVFYLLQEVAVIVLVTFISYFFIVEIGKITERQSKNKIVTVPLLGFNLVYAVGVVITGIVATSQDFYVFECKSWFWIYSGCSGTCSGLLLVGFSKYLRVILKNWSQYSASRISKQKIWQLQGFSIVVLISYLTMLADVIYKIEAMSYCFDYTRNLVANVFLFVCIRLITHFSCIFYSVYVFWPAHSTNSDVNMIDSNEFDLISPPSSSNLN